MSKERSTSNIKRERSRLTMTKRKPSAKDWEARDIADWNTTTFTEYLRAQHLELFKCEYTPFGGRWATEQGMIGRLIGTGNKKGAHKKEDVKAFIDEAFRSYRPTRDYPGTNFGFMYSYRRNILQRIEADRARREQLDSGVEVENERENLDKLMDWL